MKRSLEGNCDSKIPPKCQRIDEITQESSRTQSRSANTNVRESLRRKLLDKEKVNYLESSNQQLIEELLKEVLASGLTCKIVHLTNKYSPFIETTLVPNTSSASVLVIFPSTRHTFHPHTGPFQPVRLVIQIDGSWDLQCEIYDHKRIDSGVLQSLTFLLRDLT